MDYTHNTYENTRESTDETLRYALAVLNPNGIYDVHQMVDWYNARVNENKEGREDAIDMVHLAAYAWKNIRLPEGEISAWSVTTNAWEKVAPFVKRTKRYKGPSESIPYSTRKLY